MTPKSHISPVFSRDSDWECKISERGIFSYDKISRLLNIFHATHWLFSFISFYFFPSYWQALGQFLSLENIGGREREREIIWRELFVHFLKESILYICNFLVCWHFALCFWVPSRFHILCSILFPSATHSTISCKEEEESEDQLQSRVCIQSSGMFPL